MWGIRHSLDSRDRAQVWGSSFVLTMSLGETERHWEIPMRRLEKHWQPKGEVQEKGDCPHEEVL